MNGIYKIDLYCLWHCSDNCCFCSNANLNWFVTLSEIVSCWKHLSIVISSMKRFNLFQIIFEWIGWELFQVMNLLMAGWIAPYGSTTILEWGQPYRLFVNNYEISYTKKISHGHVFQLKRLQRAEIVLNSWIRIRKTV